MVLESIKPGGSLAGFIVVLDFAFTAVLETSLPFFWG